MKPEEFLNRLNHLPEDARGSFSASVLSLSKVATAEAANAMLKDHNFAVKINALKAIRKHNLDLFEKDVLQCLLDESPEVKVAAIKTLASFGNFRHFPLLKAFYEENPPFQGLIIESFTNYSDSESVYPFILGQLSNPEPKVQEAAIDWFNKAFGHEVIHPWILNAYKVSSFSIKRAFEKTFCANLPSLFYDSEVGNRFKLIYLIEKKRYES